MKPARIFGTVVDLHCDDSTGGLVQCTATASRGLGQVTWYAMRGDEAHIGDTVVIDIRPGTAP